MPIRFHRRSQGFAFAEIAVFAAIVILLAAIVLPGAQPSPTHAKVKSAAAQLRQAEANAADPNDQWAVQPEKKKGDVLLLSCTRQ